MTFRVMGLINAKIMLYQKLLQGIYTEYGTASDIDSTILLPAPIKKRMA